MNKIIAAVMLAFLLVIPDPALTKDHDEATNRLVWSKECTVTWRNNRSMAKTQGSIIDMGREEIEIFAEAAAMLPPAFRPGPEYHDAFGRASDAYLMLHAEQPLAFWVGIWNRETCEGAAITLPKVVYEMIVQLIGRTA